MHFQIKFLVFSSDMIRNVSDEVCGSLLGKGNKATAGADRPTKCGRTSVRGPQAPGLYRLMQYKRQT